MRLTKLLVPVLVLGLVLTACGSSKKPSASSTPPTTTSSVATPATGATVSVGTKGDSKMLVGPNGNTLYLFEKDTATISACVNGCAAVWPALTASGKPAAGPGVDATKLGTAKGQADGQVTYNGHFLYFFSGDKAPGDVNGTKIPNWYPVAPSGDKIDAS